MRPILFSIVGLIVGCTPLICQSAPATQNTAPSGSVAIKLEGFPFNDAETMAFLVLMQASKSAQEDLKAVMAGVKAINEAKAQLRKNLGNAHNLPPGPCMGAAALRECIRASQHKLIEMEVGSLDLMRGSVIAAQGELAQLREALQQAPQEAERLRKHLPPPARPLPPSPCRGWNVSFWKDCVAAVKMELSGNLPDAASVSDINHAIDDVKQSLDSMSELGETESLRLQMAMDRLSKMMSTLSNILKKISDAEQSITQNLK